MLLSGGKSYLAGPSAVADSHPAVPSAVADSEQRAGPSAVADGRHKNRPPVVVEGPTVSAGRNWKKQQKGKTGKNSQKTTWQKI
jgi:hypothetical protein